MNNNIHSKSFEARYLSLPTTPEGAAKQCELCGSEMDVKQLFWFGSVRYSAARCACSEEMERKRIVEQQRRDILEYQSRNTYTWLGSPWTDVSLREKTFENFDQSKQPEAYEAAKMFASYLKGTLVLDGTFGTGKTHLLSAICNEALHGEKRVKSLFATSATLFAAIQKRIANNEDIQGLVQRAVLTPLLCLDDIDKTKWTEWREEIYFSIIDERTKRGLPIAISTNRLEDLHLYTGGAVASRLKIGQIPVVMTGVDYREEL